MRPKKIPYRKCVACGEMIPKKELMRIVRTPEAEIKVDLTGKASGRGAYLCANLACLRLAEKQGSLGRALKSKINSEIFQLLEVELSSQVKSNES